MPQLLRAPPIPPAPLEPSPPLDPVATPSPPAAAAADEEDQVRPLPPMKLKLLFPYTVPLPRVFGRRACGMAMLGTGILMCVFKIVSFTTDAEEAGFWMPIVRAALYLCFAAIVLMACVDIGNYVAGVCAAKFDPPPPPQQPAAATVLQLPPPPPEMDMC